MSVTPLEVDSVLRANQRRLACRGHGGGGFCFVLFCKSGYNSRLKSGFPGTKKKKKHTTKTQILVPPASGSAVPNPRKLPNWNVENREGADPPFLWVGSLRVLAQVNVLPRANHRAQHLGPCHRVPTLAPTQITSPNSNNWLPGAVAPHNLHC